MTRALAVLTTLMLASGALGQDTFGIYFDELGTEYCRSDGVGQALTCYLILHNPSDATGVAGFQGQLFGDSGVYIFGLQFPVAHINAGTLPVILVGFSTPRPPEANLVLASFSVFSSAPGGVYFERLETETWVNPLYVSGSGQLRSMSPQYGGMGLPCAVMGGLPCPPFNETYGPVRTEQASWGSIKSTFR